ncbi:trifunctional ThiDN protein [Aeropyrum pernix]|uniref:Trifunctional ThiDN protein n=1 Tax=Aeropyrum pernix TaxID=56636 RepID=A0A401H983_AERPX|nr:bifunctional hydroxymethylpyrimidine kinase/phosphomethylpyrimidine kinase [Aeropyrum pernix]GBF09015.1 trifunctional ThiDN protein [Aeropyrum pernix]
MPPVRKTRIPVALTIAGSDSGGGAGIQADLKTFAVMGVHGASAITSITAQNTVEVRAIHDVPPDVVKAQVEAVADDLGVDAAKTGMLSNTGIIKAVAEVVDEYGFPLVVDPVMVAKSGARLLRPEAEEALKKLVIPRATVVTPNAPEAEVLTGVKVVDLDTAKEAARIIVEELGAEAAVVKGGHLRGEYVVDVLYHRGEYRLFKERRIEKSTTHGTGCAFSAAIAAGLAKGRSVEEAVDVAKKFITVAVDYGLEIGGGHGPVNPVAWQAIPAGRWEVLENLEKAGETLRQAEDVVHTLVPEVLMNIAMSIPYPYARTPLDVAAFPGRIGVHMGRLVFKGKPEFGASRHMARLVLAAMSVNPDIRAAGNIRYSKDVVRAAEDLGLLTYRGDRRAEPPDVKAREGGTLPWMLRSAYESLGRLPDVIYDEGEVGKEPMVRILGRTAVDVARVIVDIARRVARG